MKRPKTVKDIHDHWKEHFGNPLMTKDDEDAYKFTFYSGVFAFLSLMLVNSDITPRERAVMWDGWKDEVETELLRLAKVNDPKSEQN